MFRFILAAVKMEGHLRVSKGEMGVLAKVRNLDACPPLGQRANRVKNEVDPRTRT